MKYLLVALLLLPLSLLAQSSEPLQPLPTELQKEMDRFQIDRLMAISQNKYKGKPVQELLNSEEAKGYTDAIFRYNDEGEVEYLMLQYSPNVFLSVYADVQKPLKQQDQSSAVLEAFQKEAISKIGVRFILMQEGGE